MWSKIFEAARNNSLLDPSNLEQVNFALRKMGMPAVDKINQDVLMNMIYPNSENINMGETKEMADIPYSKGLDKHKDKFK